MLSQIFLDKKYIGKKFKEYRKKASYTQDYVAEKADLAEKHYGRLERGICLPALDTFFNIVDILSIPLSEFSIEINEEENSTRDELIKQIYLLNNKKLKALNEIIEIIKKLE